MAWVWMARAAAFSVTWQPRVLGFILRADVSLWNLGAAMCTLVGGPCTCPPFCSCGVPGALPSHLEPEATGESVPPALPLFAHEAVCSSWIFCIHFDVLKYCIKPLLNLDLSFCCPLNVHRVDAFLAHPTPVLSTYADSRDQESGRQPPRHVYW